MTTRALTQAGFFLTFAAVGLATGESWPTLIGAISAAAAAATCFIIVHRRENRR